MTLFPKKSSMFKAIPSISLKRPGNSSYGLSCVRIILYKLAYIVK